MADGVVYQLWVDGRTKAKLVSVNVALERGESFAKGHPSVWIVEVQPDGTRKQFARWTDGKRVK